LLSNATVPESAATLFLVLGDAGIHRRQTLLVPKLV
jgi:hypothetical protein